MLPVIKIRMNPTSPRFPRRLARVPELLQMTLVAQRVHRLPEALMVVHRQLAIVREPLERLPLPHRVVAVDVVADLRVEHEKAAVDPAAVADRLLPKAEHARAVRLERPEPARRLRRGDGGEAPLPLMQRDRRLHVDVADAVAISDAEGLFALDI